MAATVVSHGGECDERWSLLKEWSVCSFPAAIPYNDELNTPTKIPSTSFHWQSYNWSVSLMLCKSCTLYSTMCLSSRMPWSTMFSIKYLSFSRVTWLLNGLTQFINLNSDQDKSQHNCPECVCHSQMIVDTRWCKGIDFPPHSWFMVNLRYKISTKLWVIQQINRI